MKNLKLISTILLVALISSVFILPTSALEDPAPEASAVVLVDIETGNALYAKNEDEQRAPASLTKIMTVLLAVEAIELGEVSLYDNVTATQNMTFDLIEDGSTANIVVGETMTLDGLLYCAMVKSANEACNIIAEHISGSIQAFLSEMNAKASQLGCTGTNFTNTHGIPASGHYTTARDMALISQAAVSHPLFAAICNTAEITISATNMSEARSLVNTNGLITQNSEIYSGYYYEYASGVKTGHTEAAGYCLVSTAKKNGVNLLCVVMGGKATGSGENMSYGSFTDSINMYNWAFDNYSYRDIIKVTDIIRDIPVEMGSGADFVSVHPQSSVRALLPNDDDLQSFQFKTTIYSEESGEALVAPIAAGEELGAISIERDGVTYGSSLLVASTSVGLSYGRFISGRLGEALKKPGVIIFIIVVLALITAYVFLVVRYQRSKKEFMKTHPEARRQKAKSEKPEKERAQKPLPQPKPPKPAKPLPRPKQEEKKAPVMTAAPPKEPAQAAAPKKPAKSAPAPPRPRPKEEAPQIDYFELMSQSDMKMSGEASEADKAGQSQAERDYFEEFFGNKKGR